MIKDEWITHWLGDVNFFVRCRARGWNTCTSMEFEAYQGAGWQCSDGPNGWPVDVAYVVWKMNYSGSGDNTSVECLDAAHRAVYGQVNWDGEGHVYFGEARDEGYFYCGDLQSATNLGILLGHVWQLAWEFYLSQTPGRDSPYYERLFFGRPNAHSPAVGLKQ